MERQFDLRSHECLGRVGEIGKVGRHGAMMGRTPTAWLPFKNAGRGDFGGGGGGEGAGPPHETLLQTSSTKAKEHPPKNQATSQPLPFWEILLVRKSSNGSGHEPSRGKGTGLGRGVVAFPKQSRMPRFLGLGLSEPGRAQRMRARRIHLNFQFFSFTNSIRGIRYATNTINTVLSCFQRG
jgi:hypothetical protein